MKSNGLTFEEIRTNLLNRDILLADLADGLKVSRAHVYSIAKRVNKSQRVAECICNALDMTIEEVFGKTYTNHQAKPKLDRADRKQEIINAIQNNKPIPAPSLN